MCKKTTRSEKNTSLYFGLPFKSLDVIKTLV